MSNKRFAKCDRCAVVLPVEQLRNDGTFLFCRHTSGCLARQSSANTVTRGRDEALEVLKQAHHELTTISGLWAADNEQFTHPFRLNVEAILKRIDEVLGDGQHLQKELAGDG